MPRCLRCPTPLLVLSIAWMVSGCAAVGSRGSQAGRTAGSWSLADLQGKSVDLGDYRGQVICIAFWSTSCEPCLVELPLLQETWERHRDQGFVLLTVNIDGAEQAGTVRQLAHRHRLHVPVLLDQETTVVSRYNPKMDVPYTILIDKGGRIAMSHPGYRSGDEDKLEKEIIKLLGR